ncbi:hypothetical protein C0J52_01761, partial [Blattella germanica]
KRISNEQLDDVLNQILCENNCSELSWSNNSSDEILYDDDVIVRPFDDSASDD